MSGEMISFQGTRDRSGRAVVIVTRFTEKGGMVKQYPLVPAQSLRIRNHSPDGFEWGYAGSGPAQLSLAMLMEIMSSDEAVQIYQTFKQDVVCLMPFSGWELSGSEIRLWLDGRHGDYWRRKFDGGRQEPRR